MWLGAITRCVVVAVRSDGAGHFVFVRHGESVRRLVQGQAGWRVSQWFDEARGCVLPLVPAGILRAEFDVVLPKPNVVVGRGSGPDSARMVAVRSLI